MRKETLNILTVVTMTIAVVSLGMVVSLLFSLSERPQFLTEMIGPKISNENIWDGVDLAMNRDIQESIYDNTKVVHPREYQANNNNQEVMGIYTGIEETNETSTDYQLSYKYNIYEEADRIRVKADTFNNKNCLKIYNLTNNSADEIKYIVKTISMTGELECSLLEEKLLDTGKVLKKESKIQYMVVEDYLIGQFEVGFTYDDEISEEKLNILRKSMILTDNNF